MKLLIKAIENTINEQREELKIAIENEDWANALSKSSYLEGLGVAGIMAKARLQYKKMP